MTTTTTTDLIPSVATPATWTRAQANLMAFAGVATLHPTEGTWFAKADLGTIQAFLMVCNTTGLNPAMKQIYAAQMGGKWTVIVGIDGMRLIAQRTGEYEGQTPKEWQRADGEWVTSWTPTTWGGEPAEKPLAARVGIWRRGFRVPLVTTVSFVEFGQTPSGATQNWNVRPAHMLGIRAESHALRAAFPNELGSLYTREDLDGEQSLTEEGTSQQDADIARVRAVTDLEELSRLYAELDEQGLTTEEIRTEFMAQAGRIRGAQERPQEPTQSDESPAGAREPVDAEIVDEEPPPVDETVTFGAAPADDEVRADGNPHTTIPDHVQKARDDLKARAASARGER